MNYGLIGSYGPIIDMNYMFSSIAAKVGCNENALRLIVSAHLGYPICIIYNLFLANKPIVVKHIYYFVTGFFLCFFNYGINTFHSLGSCLLVYITLSYVMPRYKRVAVAINLTGCMLHLLYGYYVTQIGSEYSYTWTIPQCVLTLRLIALSFDVYDGLRNIELIKKRDNDSNDKISLVNEDTAVTKIPTLLELLSHAYFPGSILIGPQVKYKNYLYYIASKENFLPKCWLPAFSRLFLGLTYLAIYQIGSLYWPYNYLTSPDFSSHGFWMKVTCVAIITKISTCKYMSGWLIAEGVCIVSGASYDKITNTFYACSNVHVFRFETTPTFGGIIRSFNLTTNEFAAKYIFKRLKFVGSRTASHFLTLLFLALWHGWATGYYITFGMEFLIMKMEWEVMTLVNKLRTKDKRIDSIMSAFYVRWPLIVFFRVYTIYMFGYCLVPFTLLSFSKWYPVLTQLYFYGHLLYGSWFLLSSFLFINKL